MERLMVVAEGPAASCGIGVVDYSCLPLLVVPPTPNPHSALL